MMCRTARQSFTSCKAARTRSRLQDTVQDSSEIRIISPCWDCVVELYCCRSLFMFTSFLPHYDSSSEPDSASFRVHHPNAEHFLLRISAFLPLPCSVWTLIQISHSPLYSCSRRAASILRSPSAQTITLWQGPDSPTTSPNFTN